MNKYLSIILSCFTLLFASCAQQGDIANLQSQIDELKSGRIASIESQISSITASISTLQEADREIKGYITALQNTASELQKSINTANGKIDDLQKALTLVNTAIETLQAKDSALEKKIDDLKEYVDTQLKNTRDWVSATFTTLEQYNGIVSEIGGLRGSISSINSAMEQMESRLNGKIESTKAELESAYTKALGTLETSLKNWVNDQLKGYLTIAETEAKLAALKGRLEKEDESIREDIGKLRSSLDSTRTELTEGYKAAIKKAIDENNGIIDGKISEVVSGLNTRIDNEVSTINKRIDAIEKRIANLETQVSALVSRIQSLTYIPRYTDGASTMWVTIQSDGSTITRDTLEFRVSPADCADSLVKVWDKAITAEAVTLATRAAQETVSLPVVSVSGGKGKLSVVLDGDSLGEKFFTGDQQMKAVVVISDGNNERTSEYVSMVAKDDPKIPNNIILYTSSDGKIITPYGSGIYDDITLFGANLISNEYKNGKGTFLFDGDVTRIGRWAFCYCAELTSFIIPSSVTSIEDFAFSWCKNLTSIDLPDSIKSIGDAFTVCFGLTAIVIPNSVTSIGQKAFLQCRHLTSIMVDPTNPVYDSRNDCNAIIETKSNTLITGCNNTIIPDTVTKIGNSAFFNTHITSLIIPSSVISIGEDAFKWCVKLTSIVVDSGNPVYDSRNNCNAIIETKSNTLLLGCMNTIIPNTVTSIAGNAYGDFSIAGGAFEYCVGLTSIEIPNSVTNIDVSSFWHCDQLVSITVDSGNPVYDSRNNCNAIIETSTNTLVIGCSITIIPSSVTSIGAGAFYNCAGLTSIAIPSSVTKISDFAFYDCTGLSSIVIPSSVTRIDDRAFRGCTGLSSISLLSTNPCNLSSGGIFDYTNDCPIYVPAESVEAYKLAPGWNRYSDRIQAMP